MKQVAFWGSSPPSQPYFGQEFVDVSKNVYDPTIKVFDGQNWVVVGTLSTPPTDGTVLTLPSASTVDLSGVLQSAVVITGTVGIISLGSSLRTVPYRFVLFTGALTLNCSPGGLDLPLGRPVFTSPGDLAAFVANGGSGWRLVNYSQGLFQETSLQTIWAGFGAVGGLAESAFGGVHLVSVRAGFASVTGFASSTRLAHAATLTANLAAVATLGQSPFGGSRQIAASVAATGAARFVNT